MTYSVGGLIEAGDYNVFVGTNDAGLNRTIGVGAGDIGYGQTTLGSVTGTALISATNWAALVNRISSVASHQNTTITSRTAPVATNLIQILSNLQTDINNLETNRGNAAASGAEIVTWTGSSSKTTSTGSGQNAWTITFTHTITFPSANQARYFWNAGGIVRLRVSKSSTGTVADPEWNDLAGTLMNEIRIVGRVAGANQVIGGVTYTGVNKTSGTGTPTIFLSGTGWYGLTTTNVNIYRQFADTYPYTGQSITVAARTAGTGTQLVLTTTWNDPGSPIAPGRSDVISGGTATNSPFSAFGTAPATVVTLFPPSATHLTNSWGTPTIAASVV
jgi:hypothetical protein